MAIGRLAQGARPAPICEINTTPLVDVMLVLLVIFIITAPLLTRSLRVELPQVAASPAAADKVAVQLTIDRHGEVFVDGRAVAMAALSASLRQLTAGREGSELHLHADRATPYARVAEAMSAARSAGVQRIAFATQPGDRR